jgi:hypothetical protein
MRSLKLCIILSFSLCLKTGVVVISISFIELSIRKMTGGITSIIRVIFFDVSLSYKWVCFEVFGETTFFLLSFIFSISKDLLKRQMTYFLGQSQFLLLFNNLTFTLFQRSQISEFLKKKMSYSLNVKDPLLLLFNNLQILWWYFLMEMEWFRIYSTGPSATFQDLKMKN